MGRIIKRARTVLDRHQSPWESPAHDLFVPGFGRWMGIPMRVVVLAPMGDLFLQEAYRRSEIPTHHRGDVRGVPIVLESWSRRMS
jgi:hypothetical protein